MCCPTWDSDCDSVLDSNTMHANELNNEQPHLVQTDNAKLSRVWAREVVIVPLIFSCSSNGSNNLNIMGPVAVSKCQ